MNAKQKEAALALVLAFVTGLLLNLLLDASNKSRLQHRPVGSPVVIETTTTNARQVSKEDLYRRFDAWAKADTATAAEMREQILRDYGDAELATMPQDLRLWVLELRRGR